MYASRPASAFTLHQRDTMKHQLIYGTAWKRDDTASYVLRAIRSGFRAFDTACQPKHYREELVGEAIRQAFVEGTLTDRRDIWVSFAWLSCRCSFSQVGIFVHQRHLLVFWLVTDDGMVGPNKVHPSFGA